MRLKIVSDGTSTGTRLETERGEMVEDVVRIAWSIEGEGVGRAVITVDLAMFEGWVDMDEDGERKGAGIRAQIARMEKLLEG